MNAFSTELLVMIGVAVACVAALFATRVYFQRGLPQDLLTNVSAAQILRGETDILRATIDGQGRDARQELGQSFCNLRDGIDSQVRSFGERLDSGLRAIEERAAAITTFLNDQVTQMRNEANANRETLRTTIETKLDHSVEQQSETSKVLRDELGGNFQRLGSRVSEALSEAAQIQKERLQGVTGALTGLSDKLEKAQEMLRFSVEGRLDAIRLESAGKLEEMRQTVDEKLTSTLEARFGESFNKVADQLERVYKGFGEMKALASGVGDLKKMLSNVRVRGTFGEVQLGALLEQFLSPEQYVVSAQVKSGSQERVEFAIRLPGRDGETEVLLPVDAKFPQEDFERLVAAAEQGDSDAVASARKNLETRIKLFAKTISEKYIVPPRTTEFAILFLPTEGLFAELLRRPGFFEQLQREHRVTLAGPTTFTALLNALQMGFRSVAIDRRSSEVWQILGAVRNEFRKCGIVAEKLVRQLNSATKSAEGLGRHVHAVDKKLRDVERLPDDVSQALLGTAQLEIEGDVGPTNG